MGHPLCCRCPVFLVAAVLLRGLAGFRCRRWGVLGSGPGVAHAVDYGDGGEDGDDPEDWGHAIEECAQDYQDQALGALHEAYAAGTDQGFGAGSGIADHDGADHYEGGQDYVEEAVAAGVEDQQSEELRSVTVAVDHGIEEGSEAGYAVGGAGYFSIDQIEEAGEDDDQSGVDEHALLVTGRG